MPSSNMPWSEVLYWAGWADEWPADSVEEMKLCTELADTIECVQGVIQLKFVVLLTPLQ